MTLRQECRILRQNRNSERRFYWGFAAFIALSLTAEAGRADALAGDQAVQIVPEIDLHFNGGSATFVWRSDSKAIAYINWAKRGIGIIDVATGAQSLVPGVQMNGATRIAWSQDGAKIAISSGTEFKVAHVPDGAILAEADVFHGDPKYDLSKDVYGEFYRFNQISFSEDGSKIIFYTSANNLHAGAPPDWTPTLLQSFDLATKAVTPRNRGKLPGMRGGAKFGGVIQAADGKLGRCFA